MTKKIKKKKNLKYLYNKNTDSTNKKYSDKTVSPQNTVALKNKYPSLSLIDIDFYNIMNHIYEHGPTIMTWSDAYQIYCAYGTRNTNSFYSKYYKFLQNNYVYNKTDLLTNIMDEYSFNTSFKMMKMYVTYYHKCIESFLSPTHLHENIILSNIVTSTNMLEDLFQNAFQNIINIIVMTTYKNCEKAAFTSVHVSNGRIKQKIVLSVKAGCNEALKTLKLNLLN